MAPLLLLAFLALAGPALAERELHVVAVREGWTEPGDFRHAPRARVVVDRPGAQVLLVLLGRGEMEWSVETTPDSHIETVILGGRAAPRSRITLNGIPFPRPGDATLPFASTVFGARFRDLLGRLSGQTGLPRIASFLAVTRATASGSRIDRIDDRTEALSADYLRARLAPAGDLPAPLRRWLAGERPERTRSASFDTAGMTLTEPDGRRFFPVPPDLPAPFLPAGAHYDAEQGVLYGLTYGGEGHLYRVDTRTGHWDVIASLQRYDGAALLYDASEDLFVLTGAFARPGEIRLMRDGAFVGAATIEARRFPGLTDLYDYGNEAAPALHPRVYRDGWLLVEAIGEDGARRAYAVDIATEEVRLVEYEDR